MLSTKIRKNVQKSCEILIVTLKKAELNHDERKTDYFKFQKKSFYHTVFPLPNFMILFFIGLYPTVALFPHVIPSYSA